MMMDSSPKRYASNFTISTAHRGVEAKEVEIANARLDVNNASTLSQVGAESSQQDINEYTPLEDTGSYLQVVVEKHRRKHEQAAAAVQTARLPSASSPAAGISNQEGIFGRGSCGAGDGGSMVWAGPVLVSRAALPALRSAEIPYRCSRCAKAVWAGGKLASRHCTPKERVEHGLDARPLLRQGNKKFSWNFFRDLFNDSVNDDGLERVEVYRFEHGNGEYLAACSGVRPSRCEQAARLGARVSATALTGLLAAPRALLLLPVTLLLHLQRWTLETAREAASGCVLTASDHILKPALAMTFNALVQPALVFVRNVAQAARDALRPAAGALGDALEPAARVLAAVRLVHVHVAPHCACACPHHLATTTS